MKMGFWEPQENALRMKKKVERQPDRIPDARYPGKVERRRDRIPDVRYPDGWNVDGQDFGYDMSGWNVGGQDSGCETSGEGGTSAG